MKELIELIVTLNFKKLFFEKTDNEFIKFFRYAFVGGIAFVVDYLTFVLICMAGDSKAITVAATTGGFVTGLITNFILSKKFVFQEKANTKSTTGEFIGYAVIGLIGYGLNVLLMLLMTEPMSLNRYVAKLIAAAIVLIYNYLARKIFLYNKK